MIWYINIILIFLWIWLLLQHIYGLWWYYFFASLIIGMFAYIINVDIVRLLIVSVATLLSWILVKIILRYVMLSVYPKYVFYIVLSMVCMFLMIDIAYSYGWYVIEQSSLWMMMMFAFIYIIHSIKILQYMKTSWGWLRYVLYLWLISVYYLWWEYFYPMMTQTNYLLTLWLIWIIFIVSMYDGLQIKEMLRFRKLFTNRFKK